MPHHGIRDGPAVHPRTTRDDLLFQCLCKTFQ
jgi:hypothetical protein